MAFWPARLASSSMRCLGLVATQTLMFLFADIEGSAAMARLGDAWAAGAGLKDLGLHRLRDGGRAERIFQLQAEVLPAAFRRCGRWRS